MSPFVVKAIQLLMSLSLLIVLHELGHFIPARIFKTRVEKFFLFFDVKFALFKKKIGETTYGIGWLPLGGYVKRADASTSKTLGVSIQTGLATFDYYVRWSYGKPYIRISHLYDDSVCLG